MKAFEQSFVPKNRKDQKAPGKGKDIENTFGAEGVVNFGGCLADSCDTEEMKVNCETRDERGAEKTAQGNEAEQANVAEIRDALLRRKSGRSELLEERCGAVCEQGRRGRSGR